MCDTVQVEAAKKEIAAAATQHLHPHCASPASSSASSPGTPAATAPAAPADVLVQAQHTIALNKTALEQPQSNSVPTSATGRQAEFSRPAEPSAVKTLDAETRAKLDAAVARAQQEVDKDAQGAELSRGKSVRMLKYQQINEALLSLQEPAQSSNSGRQRDH